jgi:hypothetical protein
MSNWFANLVQKVPGLRLDTSRIPDARAVGGVKVRPREEHQNIVAALRARAKAGAADRQQRFAEYKEFIKKAPPAVQPAPGAPARVPLLSFRTRVPFRLTQDARQILDELRKKHPGSKATFPQGPLDAQVVLLAGSPIGEMNVHVEKDPKLVNVMNHGFKVSYDRKGSLQFRFGYPVTSSRISARRNANQGDLLYKLRSPK